MTKKKKETIYAFIDSQNLNLGVRTQRWKLDFKKFAIYLKEKLHVKKAYLFIGYIEKNKNLYKKLKQFGFELIFKPTIDTKGLTKGNVDAELVLHTMIQYDNYTQAVIVTGDGDFHCLVEYLEKQNKLDYLVIPNKNKFSSLLRKFGKKIVFITELKDILNHKKREV